jgi:hypothetical protein
MGAERWRDEFMEGLKEGFAGVPMDFPEGIRPLGEFHVEGGTVEEIEPGAPMISPNLDDEVIDAEIID